MNAAELMTTPLLTRIGSFRLGYVTFIKVMFMKVRFIEGRLNKVFTLIRIA